MGDAAEALSNQQASEAIEAQRRALNELKTYAQDLTEQAQELGMAGQAPGLQPGEENGGTDPLGRAISGDDVSVGYGDDMLPSERARKRSREILDQLRQKLRDPSLDQASKDYIKRLLERFDGEASARCLPFYSVFSTKTQSRPWPWRNRSWIMRLNPKYSLQLGYQMIWMAVLKVWRHMRPYPYPSKAYLSARL